ncbi:hypothetical protein [Curtobacterium sp. YR515]|uniref:hypothetical protein n=1 Tax=Curtobacterium sp. YR515 TaxID=1855316 RepID=UPI0008F2CED2|nr:hypothetical protein [Curtobacterium sp. YR515]SFF71756.1 hypothetical protein SAMN05216329_2323 [Curtobacterium sp. YR515]
MAQRGPTRPTARIEEAIGFVGTFGILFLGATVFCELTGRPALGWALTLLVCVLGVVVLDRWRVSVLRRTRSTDGVGAPAPVVAPVARPSAAPVVAAGSGPSGWRSDPSRIAVQPAADGRVHRHVGWDELAPAGRRAARTRRVAPIPGAAPGTALPGAGSALPGAGSAPTVARAQTGPVADVRRPSDG